MATLQEAANRCCLHELVELLSEPLRGVNGPVESTARLEGGIEVFDS